MDVKKAALVIDYQNTHLTASRLFGQNRPLHENLIDPVKYLEVIERIKNGNKQDPSEPDTRIEKVVLCRGLPLAARDPENNRRNIHQKRNWEKDAKSKGIDLQVCHRNLKYYDDGSVSEKGVDIMCALALVRLARTNEYDAIILSSRDTDLCPALEEANTMSDTKIEAVKWVDNSKKESWGFLQPNFKLWTTQLKVEDFKKCIDDRYYL